MLFYIGEKNMNKSQKQRLIRIVKAVIKKVLIIMIINLGIASAIWSIFGLRTFKNFGAIIVMLGFACLILGCGALSGTYKRRGDLTQRLNLSAIGVSVDKQNQIEMKDTDKALRSSIGFFLVGLFTMIIGGIVYSL